MSPAFAHIVSSNSQVTQTNCKNKPYYYTDDGYALIYYGAKTTEEQMYFVNDIFRTMPIDSSVSVDDYHVYQDKFNVAHADYSNIWMQVTWNQPYRFGLMQMKEDWVIYFSAYLFDFRWRMAPKTVYEEYNVVFVDTPKYPMHDDDFKKNTNTPKELDQYIELKMDQMALAEASAHKLVQMVFHKKRAIPAWMINLPGAATRIHKVMGFQYCFLDRREKSQFQPYAPGDEEESPPIYYEQLYQFIRKQHIKLAQLHIEVSPAFDTKHATQAERHQISSFNGYSFKLQDFRPLDMSSWDPMFVTDEEIKLWNEPPKYPLQVFDQTSIEDWENGGLDDFIRIDKWNNDMADNIPEGINTISPHRELTPNTPSDLDSESASIISNMSFSTSDAASYLVSSGYSSAVSSPDPINAFPSPLLRPKRLRNLSGSTPPPQAFLDHLTANNVAIPTDDYDFISLRKIWESGEAAPLSKYRKTSDGSRAPPTQEASQSTPELIWSSHKQKFLNQQGILGRTPEDLSMATNEAASPPSLCSEQDLLESPKYQGNPPDSPEVSNLINYQYLPDNKGQQWYSVLSPRIQSPVATTAPSITLKIDGNNISSIPTPSPRNSCNLTQEEEEAAYVQRLIKVIDRQQKNSQYYHKETDSSDFFHKDSLELDFGDVSPEALQIFQSTAASDDGYYKIGIKHKKILNELKSIGLKAVYDSSDNRFCITLDEEFGLSQDEVLDQFLEEYNDSVLLKED